MQDFWKYMLYGTIVGGVIWLLLTFELLVYLLIFFVLLVIGMVVDAIIEEFHEI